MGYCKTILIPNVTVYEKLRGGLPKHLTEVGARFPPIETPLVSASRAAAPPSVRLRPQLPLHVLGSYDGHRSAVFMCRTAGCHVLLNTGCPYTSALDVTILSVSSK